MNKMIMNYLDVNGMKLSQIGIGTASFKNYTNIPRLIELTLGFGINWIDTSKSYINNNLLHNIGKALKYYERSRYYILSKISPLECKIKYDDIYDYIQMQCNALCCNYLDMLAIDSINGFSNIDEQISTLNEYEDIREILDKLKESGIVKNIGFVYIGEDNDNIDKVMSLYDWDFVELRYTIFDIKLSNMYQTFKKYKENNPKFNIILMGLFDHGILHNISINNTKSEEIILKYYTNKNDPMILGVSTFSQLHQLISIYSNLNENKIDENMIDDIFEYTNSVSDFNCRGCLRCAYDICDNVSMYTLIQKYNKYKYSGDSNDIKMLLMNIDLESINIDKLNQISCLSGIDMKNFIEELKVLKQEII